MAAKREESRWKRATPIWHELSEDVANAQRAPLPTLEIVNTGATASRASFGASGAKRLEATPEFTQYAPRDANRPQGEVTRTKDDLKTRESRTE